MIWFYALFCAIFSSKKKLTLSPRAPYSGPMNMLKAMHFHNRITNNNLLPVSQHSSVDDIQRLANVYSAEDRETQISSSSSSTLISSSNPSASYKLVSVVCHLGDVYSGHFVTYRRAAPSGNGERFPQQWIYCSDEITKPATVYEALNANAYMLFYERI